MNQTKVKELAMDILVDVVAGMVIAIGVYNFALNANFPVAGFPESQLFSITYSESR